MPLLGKMSMEPFAFEVLLDDDYDEAVGKVTAALKNEGFGVITQIDVKATIKEKLGEDFRLAVPGPTGEVPIVPYSPL